MHCCLILADSVGERSDKACSGPVDPRSQFRCRLSPDHGMERGDDLASVHESRKIIIIHAPDESLALHVVNNKCENTYGLTDTRLPAASAEKACTLASLGSLPTHHLRMRLLRLVSFGHDTSLCANDDETKTCREFTLEILWGVRRG